MSRAWKSSRKKGVPLNKGTPIYNRMSAPIVCPGHRDTKYRDSSALFVSENALLRILVSKNFLLPTYYRLPSGGLSSTYFWLWRIRDLPRSGSRPWPKPGPLAAGVARAGSIDMGTRGAGRAQRCPLLDLHPLPDPAAIHAPGAGPGSGAAGATARSLARAPRGSGRPADITPATKIGTNPYSRFGPATADGGSRGIRDQPRNPRKYTEKRIRINFPFPCLAGGNPRP